MSEWERVVMNADRIERTIATGLGPGGGHGEP